jgi:hypothetical protein
MTENDIIRDMEFCSFGKCGKCSREEDSEMKCREKLFKDAVSVIKIQQAAIEEIQEDRERLKAENKRLDEALNHNYTKLELVKAVNCIIVSCHEKDCCFECGGDEWGGKIDAIRDFVKLIGKDGCSLVVGIEDDYPLIQYIELKK